jgi:hypothetical protein
VATSEFFEEGLRYLQTNRAFVGREFLTWLWFVSESQSHLMKVQGFGEFRFFVDDRLVLSSSGGSVHEHVLKGGTPAYATEAQVSLRQGKLVHEAKFVMQEGERQWSWTMRADDLSLRSVKLPAVQEADAASHMATRISLMQFLVDVVDALFKEYMGLRISPQFDEELSRIQTWLESKESL